MKHTQLEIHAATSLSALGNLRRFMPLLFDNGRTIRLAAFALSRVFPHLSPEGKAALVSSAGERTMICPK